MCADRNTVDFAVERLLENIEAEIGTHVLVIHLPFLRGKRQGSLRAPMAGEASVALHMADSFFIAPHRVFREVGSAV